MPAASGSIKRLLFPRWAGFARAQRGATAVEFALVLPILLTVLMGVVAYGRFFLVCHLLQQAANDAARAGAVELTADARRAAGTARARSSLTATGGVDPSRVAVTVDERDGAMVVSLAYDLSGEPLLSLPVVSLPRGAVTERGVALLGGL